MIKIILLTSVVLVAVVILGISSYLSPDDLRKCDQSPSGQGLCQKVDAVVAVSGGKTAIRAAEAISLYKNGWSDRIIFSGDAFDPLSPSNASVMRKQALDEGVPDSAIITEETSRTTHQNAEKTNDIIQKYDITSLIIVTSPYHQRRANIEFHQFTDERVRILNHPVQNDPDWQWYWWATPRGWWLAAGELAKIGATTAGEPE